MNITTYGLDVAKRVFQMYWVDAQTGEIMNRRFDVTVRPNGAGRFRRNGATWSSEFEGSNGVKNA